MLGKTPEMNVLIVGNSFGTDAARYLNGVSRSLGCEICVVNLYIGGCSLERHYANMLSEEDAYDFEINGISHIGLHISYQNALLLKDWDWIIFQQCSPKSGEYVTYEPFLSSLAAYARRICPAAKIGMQLTWTFAHGCSRFELTPFKTPEEMLPEIIKAYELAASVIGAELLIPSGKAMAKLYREIGPETYRDGFHSNLGVTRYMLACLWFSCLTGQSAAGNEYRDFDIPVTEEMRLLAQQIAQETAEEL